MLIEIHLDQHFLLSGIVGQHQSQLLVERGPVSGFGVGEDGDEVTVGAGEDGDVAAADLAGTRVPGFAEFGFGTAAGGLGLGDPSGDEDGVSAGFEGSPVGGQLGVTVGDGGAGALSSQSMFGVARSEVLGGGEEVDGVVEAVRGEDLGEPVVEGAEDVLLPQVDVAGVLDAVGEGVLLGEAAAVVRLAVDPLGLGKSSPLVKLRTGTR